MTSPERHERLMGQFDDACQLAPDAQIEYLRKLAVDDADLARELAELLAHDRAAGGTLEAVARDRDPPTAPTQPLTAAARGTPGLELEGAPDLDPVALLGAGGMGRVLLARQRTLDREVAVKVPNTAEGADDLRAEALLTGSLEHPNIVPVHLLERDRRGRPVLVMKRVEGVSWGTLLRSPEHPAWTPLLGEHGDRLGVHLWILNGVCRALHFAHDRGVVHRDVKPDNVMVGGFGEVYLVDWGIAARTAAGSVARRAPRVVGTPGFLAPEMLEEGAPVIDPRTDVHLLGATLHFVLVGSPRHAGSTLYEQLAAARASLPYAYAPEVPEELAAICNRATQRDPAQRFATAEAFREAINDYQRHRGAQALSDAAWERLERLVEEVASAQADPRRVHELAKESQFGFQQSLRAWSGNARARDGLRRCLKAQLAHEIGQQNLGRAQALLDELDDPAPELVARVAALRERVRTRDAREAKLAALEHAWDWRVAARQRSAVLVLVCALSIALWRFAVRGYPLRIPPATLALYAVAAFGVMAALVAVFRRRLFATAVTRHLVVGVLCSIAAMAANRAMNAITAPPTAAILSGDLLLAALSAALTAVSLARWFWLLVPIFTGASLVARLAPNIAGLTFVVAATAALAIGLVASANPKRAK